MLFNTYVFLLLFLPMTVAGYFIFNYLKKYEIAKIFLLCMSCIFCGYYNWYYAVIMAASILINFGIGTILQKDAKKKWKKAFLLGGLILNIGALLYFKYFDFFIENMNQIFRTSFNLKHIILPLGISFFTFQQISYLVDCYRGETPKYHFVDYALFIAFFPKLTQGPIAFHSELIPQFQDIEKKTVNYENLSKGIYAFACGLGKKVLIANLLAKAVDFGYANVNTLNATEALIVMLAYTFQIYFDFSGYCDMASGIGFMFNIELPINFDSPYKSLTITEFWSKWHITLTRFFTKYVYIPLGGNRKGKVRTYVNIMIVFIISGLWHGAAWTFVLWGALHGIAQVITKIFKEKVERLHAVLNWIITFGFVNVAWVFFRAASVQDAIGLIKSIFSFNFAEIRSGLATSFQTIEYNTIMRMIDKTQHIEKYLPNLCVMIVFVLCFLIILGSKNTMEKIKDFKPTIWKGIGTVILLIWCIVSFAGVSTFVYIGF